MKATAEEFASRLNLEIPNIILISGDEPLLVQETEDTLRAQIKALGPFERVIFDIDGRFNWDRLHAQGQLMSLFSEKTLVECRMPSGKPGTQGAKAIDAWLNASPPDQILMITCGKLDASQQKSQWVKKIERQGIVVQIWPIKPQQMPNWIRTRARLMGLAIDNQALEFLSEHAEGNCLAAKQELEKLKLIYGEISLNIEHVQHAVVNSSRYNIFELIDACLSRHPEKSAKIFQGMRHEGQDCIMILMMLTREIRLLAQIATRVEQGQSFQEATLDARLWQTRKLLVERALSKRPAHYFLRLLQTARQIDAMIKGAREGNPWFALFALIMNLSGKPMEIQQA